MPDVTAPGARIVCRDAEWLVKSASLSSAGDRIIEAIGVSEFIRGKSARFLQELEQDNLQILLPEETALVSDKSPGYRHSLLFLEAQLRQTAPDDGRIYTGSQAAMDLLPYQLRPAYDALQMPRQRILIADAVGLGKTLECGILASELIRRGRGRRILVVTTKAMLTQFQKEFWARFTIPLVPLDSTTIQRIRTRIPGNHNPFHYYDRTIISVDTLKQDREYRSYLEEAHWDIIIIDEAHNVARRGHGASQRSRLAKRLSTCSDTLILLSATPHDGRPASFASLMNMLDPTAIANEADYTKEDIRDLYIRRFKKDVLQDLKQYVPERQVEAVEAQASPAEERVFDCLSSLKFCSIDSHRQAGHLFKTTLLKAMLSSPAACLATVKNRIKRLEAKAHGASGHPENNSIEKDIEQLVELRAALEQVSVADFSKYQTLLSVIRQDFGWTGKEAKDRLVIFTGRLDTLRFLKEHLAKDLKGLNEGAIATLDGGMADVDQTHMVEAFGQESSPIRILLATEVASEGLNLHYLSHRLIHFEAPWSLMTLQQRNGRIDRYGQTQQPQIRYLLTRSKQSRMDEVERIIKVLLEKDEQAVKNIGDPSVFMGVFDAAEEETVTARAIESGLSADDFAQQLEANAASGGEGSIFDWFEELDTATEASESPILGQSPVAQGKLLSLFSSTFEFAKASLQSLDSLPENLSINEAERFVELQLPPELERRYKRLPKQILPQTGILHLSDRPEVIMQSMEAARREEDTWPAKQYLWDLHPVVEWLNDRNLFRFGRHEAPVIQLGDGLMPQEATFVLFGSFPNRRGVPVMSRWLSAIFQAGEFQWIEPFEKTVERTGLGTQPLPNRGAFSVEGLLPLRAEAVGAAQRYLRKEHQTCEALLTERLAEQRSRLETLRDRHIQQLELRFAADQRRDTIKAQEKQRERSHIDRIFKDHQDWVDLSMTTEAQPYVRLVAVLVNNVDQTLDQTLVQDLGK